jgi:hypothetical protein
MEEQSRPPTAFSRAQSPETAPEEDSDYASRPTLSRRNSRGTLSEGPTTARGRRREANLATQGHSEIINPMPEEYKEEVDRIFRAFLSRICSNRKSFQIKELFNPLM